MDRGQRRNSVFGFPLAVIYKFFDDQGNYLAAILTFYAFLSIFPLLLLATSILGFVLDGRPDLQEQVLDSALGQFPIIGTELGRPDGIQGSTGGIIVVLQTLIFLGAFVFAPKHGLLAARRRAAEALETTP